MVTVFVCLGSSCYVRGSEDIAAIFEALVQEHGLEKEVDLRGSLCMEHCSMGVSVRVGERVYHQLGPESAEAFFFNEIVPLTRQGAETA